MPCHIQNVADTASVVRIRTAVYKYMTSFQPTASILECKKMCRQWMHNACTWDNCGLRTVWHRSWNKGWFCKLLPSCCVWPINTPHSRVSNEWMCVCACMLRETRIIRPRFPSGTKVVLMSYPQSDICTSLYLRDMLFFVLIMMPARRVWHVTVFIGD